MKTAAVTRPSWSMKQNCPSGATAESIRSAARWWAPSVCAPSRPGCARMVIRAHTGLIGEVHPSAEAFGLGGIAG